MDNQREYLRCHTCNKIQRDRRVYRDHLLAHGEVSSRRHDVPVRLEERELAVMWVSVRREELGLPRVSDCEAKRQLRDNRARTAR